MTTTLPPLVGLIGKKRVGKDTFAAVLVEEFGFARVAFADPLKEMALTIDPWVDNDLGSPLGLSQVVAQMGGWERTKDQIPEVRRFLQRLGDGVRQFDPEFWVRAGMREVYNTRGSRDMKMWQHVDNPRPVVITDVRYPNEADAIREAGGTLVRIVRPGVDDGDAHASETALDGYDADILINNDGDLDGLRYGARTLDFWL